jgi:hypothetical protein
MTATEIMTTITLAARLASSACRAQNSLDKVRNDPGCQGQERSDGQYSGAAEKRFDRR